MHLMLVFKYLHRVFKYMTIAYNNYPVKKCIVINYCAHIRPIHDFVELSEDQRHISKKIMTAYLQYMVQTQMRESFHRVSKD